MTYPSASLNEHDHRRDGDFPDEKPACIGQWCCGCTVHPIGKPWGWNHEAWSEHRAVCPQSESKRTGND